MNHEDTLVNATAAFERLTAATAVAMNLGAFLFVEQLDEWATGTVAAAVAMMFAAASQWKFRCAVNVPAARAKSGYLFRQVAVLMWIGSVAAFAVGALN